MSEIPKQPVSPEGQSMSGQPKNGYEAALAEMDAFQAELQGPNFSVPTVGPKNDAEQAIENGVYDRAYAEAMDKIVKDEGPMASSAMGEYARTGEHNLFSYRVAEAADEAVEHHRNVKALAEQETRAKHGEFLGKISAANADIKGAFDEFLAPNRTVDPNAAPDTFVGWFGKGSANGAKKTGLGEAFGARRKADPAENPTVEVSYIDPAPAEGKPADKPASKNPEVVEGKVVPEQRTTDAGEAKGDAPAADAATTSPAIGRAKVPAQPEGDADLAAIPNEPTSEPDADPAKPDDDLDATPMASKVLWDQGKFPAAYGFRGENLGENLGVYPEAHGKPEKVDFADETLDINNMGETELEFIDLIAARNEGRLDISEKEFMSRMKAIDQDKTHPGLGMKLFDRFAVDGKFVEALPEDQDAGLTANGARLIRALRENYERPSAKVTEKITKLLEEENKREGRVPLEYALDANGNPVYIEASKAKGDVTPKVRNGDLLLETFLGAAPKEDEIKNAADTRGKLAKLRGKIASGLGKLLVRGEGPLMDGDWYKGRYDEIWGRAAAVPSEEKAREELRFVNTMPYSDLKFMSPAELSQRLTSQEARDRLTERRAEAGYTDEYENGTTKATPAAKPSVRPKRTYRTVAQPNAAPAAQPSVAQEAQSVGESYPAPYTLGEQAFIDQFENDERKDAEEYVNRVREAYRDADDALIDQHVARVRTADPDHIVEQVESNAYLVMPRPIGDAMRARYDEIVKERMNASPIPWEDDDVRAA